MFVFSLKKWQDPLVPVEKGEDGWRTLPVSPGYSSVITARLPDVVVLRCARAVISPVIPSVHSAVSGGTGDFNSKRGGQTMGWTDERVELLKKLWAEG